MKYLINRASAISPREDLDELIYSLIRVNDYNLAQELYFRIQDDASTFGKLAREFSEGLEKFQNGLVGPVPVSKAHEKLRSVLKSSQIGFLNKPFSINNQWLICRVESLNVAKLNDNVRLKMTDEIFNEKIDNLSLKMHDRILTDVK